MLYQYIFHKIYQNWLLRNIIDIVIHFSQLWRRATRVKNSYLIPCPIDMLGLMAYKHNKNGSCWYKKADINSKNIQFGDQFNGVSHSCKTANIFLIWSHFVVFRFSLKHVGLYEAPLQGNLFYMIIDPPKRPS